MSNSSTQHLASQRLSALEAMPQAIEAEKALLGAILYKAQLFPDIALIPQDFYRAQHRDIYKAMLAVAAKGDAIDPVTVSRELAHYSEDQDETAYYSELNDLASAAFETPNLESMERRAQSHATLIKGTALKRRLIAFSGKVQVTASNGSKDPYAEVMAALREIDPDRQESAEQERQPQAERLFHMALERCELFRSSDGGFFAKVQVNDHIETMSINERGGSFKRWLTNLYCNEFGSIPGANALSSAIGALEARAQFESQGTYKVYVRFAYQGGNIYLDMVNEAHEVIEITPQGWTIKKDVPVCFRRPNGMLPLPTPERGGSLDELHPIIHIKNDDDWLLLKAFLLGMCHPTGPYPILNLSGEQGAAKSSAARWLRSVIDPHEVLLRKEPKDEQTFAVYAHNNYVVAFDNLSHISSRLSDLLCTLSTGGGDGYRKHYTNDEEQIFSYKRPQIFTGIENMATRGDLIDRCISINLDRFEESEIKEERVLNEAFEKAHPRILGALLDAISLALRNAPHMQVPRLSRMADFTKWVISAEQLVSDTPGRFLDVYRQNRVEGIATEIEASSLASALVLLMADSERWEGTATELLTALEKLVSEKTTQERTWPKIAKSLTSQLKRLTTSLRVSEGISIAYQRTNTSRIILLTKQQPPDPNPEPSKKGDAKGDANTPKGDANNRVRHPLRAQFSYYRGYSDAK